MKPAKQTNTLIIVEQEPKRQADYDRLLRLKGVLDRIGLSRSYVYQLIAEGRFPAPIRVGRAALFSEQAINQWIEEQKAGGES